MSYRGIVFYIFIFGFIYRPHVLIPQSGWQLWQSDTQAPSQVISCDSDRPFVIKKRQVCILSIKSQVSTTLHYTITVCCNRTAHSQHCLPISVEARELNLKYARATGELNPGLFAPAAECVTTRPPRPFTFTLRYTNPLTAVCRLISPAHSPDVAK